MKQQIKRRRYPLVYRSHQYRFLALNLIYNLIIVAFLVIALFVPDIIQLQDENLSIEVRAVAADKILNMHSRVWPAIIALICVIGMHSFRIFHGFIGPLYRFNMAFEQVRNGDLSLRVKLRKEDYLHQEEEAFNEMIEILSEKIRSIQLAGKGVLESLRPLEEKATQGSAWKETDKELLSVLRRHLDTLMDTVRYFQTTKSEEEHGRTGL